MGETPDTTEVDIRLAREADLPAVAGLRWHWDLEKHPAPNLTRAEFIRRFADWAKHNTASHRCLVAVRAETVIGMAWLAVTARVPTPRSTERASGDLQSVYLVPTERAGGVGARLVTTALALARDSGLERVTVHSSSRAVTVYARNGFEVSPKLLHAVLT